MGRFLIPLGVRVIFKPAVTLKQLLVKPKGPSPREGEIVIPSPLCQLSSHMRRTERKAIQPATEGAPSGSGAGGYVNSTLAELAWGCHHPVKWEHVRVLNVHHHLYPRLTLESVHIRSQSNLVNRDLRNMPQVYNL